MTNDDGETVIAARRALLLIASRLVARNWYSGASELDFAAEDTLTDALDVAAKVLAKALA